MNGNFFQNVLKFRNFFKIHNDLSVIHRQHSNRSEFEILEIII